MKKLTTEDFIARAKAVHGDRYGYELVEYRYALEKVEIVCREHGAFLQTASTHMCGYGCKKCMYKKLGQDRRSEKEDFIKKARDVHGPRYDYTKLNYKNRRDKVEIVCNKHGSFTQLAYDHTAGKGCPKCSNLGPSNGELEVLEFVQSLGLDVVGSDRTVISPKEIDIYVPSKKIGIEYNGVHFHSDKYKNKNDHKHKSDLCAAAGVRLIHMLEADWQERRPQMERMIRNALGMSNDRKINARDCYVEQISVADANVFLAQWHPQGKGGHNAVPFGLKTKTDNELVAVMTFAKDAYRRNPATANRDEQWGNWDLTRYTTSASVRGGASKLFKHFVEWSGADIVQSFSANNWFSGGLYPALGFVVKEHTAPDYQVWHPKTGIRGKSTWRRTNIPLRLKEIGSDLEFDPETTKMTEWMVEDAVGAKRIWDSGKIKWEWQADNRK